MLVHRRLPIVLAALAVILCRSQSGAAQDTLPEKKAVLARLEARRNLEVAAIDRVKAAVVNIHSERTVQASAEPFTNSNRINGMGTGIVIDPRGYIVTNQHVVEDVNLLRIRLVDGSTYNAQVVSRNPELDLALLKIDAPQPLATMPMGTASDLMVGETVIAIGNAYGYEHTVSKGIVSAIKRDVSLNKELSYKSLIQTDASINPGNSGGPLINIHGELVGVNVAIRAGAQGIGFAIPVDNMIRAVAEMFRLRRRGFCHDGLIYQDFLERADDGIVRLVVVNRVETNSPGASAGIRPGDVLVKVGAVKIACSFDVERALLDRRGGDAVPVVLRRQNQEQHVELVLVSADRASAKQTPLELVWSKLGMHLAPIATEQVARINRQLHGGLEVTAVHSESAAAKAGIRKGDILVGLHQWETLTLDNVLYVLNHPDWSNFQPLSFYIVRGGQVRRGWLAQSN